MSNTGSFSHFRVQIVLFSEQSVLRISGKDCLVKLEIWLIITDDRLECQPLKLEITTQGGVLDRKEEFKPAHYGDKILVREICPYFC